MTAELEEIAARVVRMALEGGADDAECTASAGEEFTASVRMRELEQLKNAGSRAAGVRVLIGKRAGSAYSSDLTPEGLRRMVDSALELARITSEDPYAGLPESGELGRLEGDLQLYYHDLAALPADTRIQAAKAAEEAALAHDRRIVNSEGASVDTRVAHRAFANSRGFCGSYSASRCSVSVVPVAKENGSMERDYWYEQSRSAAALEHPDRVGRRAAERAIRRLKPRKVATQTVPVIFEPEAARTLLEHVFEAVNGDAVYRNASFLAGKLGEKVASEKLTLVDDGTLPGLFGTAPFDDEGVPTRRTVVIERGVLTSYLLNTYTARKLGLKTTGNASRGLTGNAGVGHGNLFAEPGEAAPEELIHGVRQGLYVTELIGFGVNTVTGEYSRGAAGLWIENGELAYPVSEVTVSGNLQQMLEAIEAVANDLDFRAATACPTLLVAEMTVSGQ